MNVKTYFSVLFKRAKTEQEVKRTLFKISDLKHIKQNDEELKNLFDEFQKEQSFENHFEIIFDLAKESERDIYLKKMSSLFDTSKTALNKDFKAYCEIKKEQQKQSHHSAFTKYLEKAFELDYTPVVERGYNQESNILTFRLKESTFRLCNLFVPVSKIQSEIEGEKRTHLKIHMKYEGKTVEIVESSRKLTKADKLNDIFGDHGFLIDNSRASQICKFISDYLLENQSKIKDEYGRSQTGWHDGTFYLPNRQGQQVVWLEDKIKKSYTTKGTYTAQKELIQELTKGKVFIPILGAFASPLYGVVDDIKNFFIHLGGLTGEGKSIAVETALSFFGSPMNMGTNWNATINGLETYWEQNHSMPMWIDEMEITNKLEDIVNAIYTFNDGHGKNRAFVDGGEIKQRRLKTFKGICYSTAEKSFSEIQNTIKNRIKPRGGTRRIMDFNINNLWDGIDRLKAIKLMKKNQGFLGLEYISFLEANAAAINTDYDNHVSFFIDLGLRDGAEIQYGLLKLVLHILHSMKLINDKQLEKQIKFLVEFATETKNQYEKIKDVYGEFKDTFTEFIITNLSSFDYLKNGGTMWREHDKEPFLGKVDFDSNEINIFPKEFEKWCVNNGFVKQQVLEALNKKQKLYMNKGREKYFDKNVRIDGKQIKCHQIKGLFENDIEIVFEDAAKEVTKKEDPTPVVIHDAQPPVSQQELDLYK